MAIDGITTFSALLASLFGALYPSEGYVNALFFSFLLTLFSTPLHALLHHRCMADLRYVVACDIGLLLQGPIMLLTENPIGPWALLIFLIVPTIAIPLSKIEQPRAPTRSKQPKDKALGPKPEQAPSHKPRRRGRPRQKRRKKGRRRRKARSSPPLKRL